MSKIETNTIDNISGSSALQIGDTNTATIGLGKSGDTITIPSGATIVNSGTATNFGQDNDLVKIGEASTTSAAASLTVDNCFTTTYDMYRVIGFLTPSSSGAHCLVRWRTGGASGSTYSTADYSWITEGQYIQSSGPSSAQYLNWNYSADAARVASDCGDGTDKAVLFNLLIGDPLTQELAHPFTTGTSAWKVATNNRWVSTHMGWNNTAAIDATGLIFSYSTGNIAKGKFIVYGYNQT